MQAQEQVPVRPDSPVPYAVPAKVRTKNVKLKAYFFDFYGTLHDRKFWDTCDAQFFHDISNALFGTSHHVVQEWMRGEISADYVCNLMGKRIGCDSYEIMTSLLRGFKSWSLSVSLLAHLENIRRHGNYTFLVSDNMDVVLHWIYISGTADYFDDVWVSCTYGSLKADDSGRAYLSLARKWDVSFENCVLFDDDTKPIDTFTALGGTAHKVESPDHTQRLLRGLRLE